jgi:hypothetical protein
LAAMPSRLVPVRRVRLPWLGTLAFWRDHPRCLLATHLEARHYRRGRLLGLYELGSGVITVTFCNALVTAAIAASGNPFADFAWHDAGSDGTPATDGDTALGAPIGTPRVQGTITAFQVADSSNHLAILDNTASITFPSGATVQEWAIFNASTAGDMADRRAFAPISVDPNDGCAFSWRVSIASGL